MGLKLSKLEKLAITAYREGKRESEVGSFEAMFNPADYKRTYSLEWGSVDGLNASGPQLSYRRSGPSDLRIKLLLDGTGVTEAGRAAYRRQSVEDRVEKFLEVAYNYDGEIHQPHFLILEWGSLALACRLKTVQIHYTAFHRDGTPIRAELDATFLTDKELDRRLRKENRRSPDLTRRRIVRQGETLPLLTRQVYGSAEHYPAVARHNDLDHFRGLEPGRELFFPPLQDLNGGGETP